MGSGSRLCRKNYHSSDEMKFGIWFQSPNAQIQLGPSGSTKTRQMKTKTLLETKLV